MGQLSIPVEDEPQVHKQCGWCTAPARVQLELEPERYRYETKNGKRNKLVAKHAIVVGACIDHKDILDHQPSKEKPDEYKVKK